MTYQNPCTDPEKRDDWFIAKDGKQYPDDEFLTNEEKDDLASDAARMVENALNEDRRPYPEVLGELVADAEDELKRQALIRRRKARDACYECYFRVECLDIAMSDDTIKSGTWGGYYEEQLKVIKAERNRRKRKNRGSEEQQGS